MKITTSAPGRICLFGEHQDYLNLPVITMAIDRRVYVTGTINDSGNIKIDLPDIKSKEEFKIGNGFLTYNKEREYFKSCFNVLMKNNLHPVCGIECSVCGNIPINSGTSSSSALNNAWIAFLLKAGDNFSKIKAHELGFLSYLAEVEEFKEAGGMMDQIACAAGGAKFIEFGEIRPKISDLEIIPGTFVLGDSLQPKDTQKILSETKIPALRGLEKLKSAEPHLNFKNIKLKDIEINRKVLTEKERIILTGAVKNRDLTLEALSEFQSPNPDWKKTGEMLTALHEILSADLRISTEKIDRMVKSALKAGAIGGKINGSGGGGCMFAYAPDNPAKVKEAIENEGGKAWIIRSDVGVL
ncbi:MAG: GHMP kinase [Candidatus Cloacimonadota bacterium]|nr:MAG: GHMP kinase [Candidatus Cloacimonadota bacterium]